LVGTFFGGPSPQLHADIEDFGHPPLMAELHLAEARVAIREERYGDAERSIEHGIDTAIASSHREGLSQLRQLRVELLAHTEATAEIGSALRRAAEAIGRSPTSPLFKAMDFLSLANAANGNDDALRDAYLVRASNIIIANPPTEGDRFLHFELMVSLGVAFSDVPPLPEAIAAIELFERVEREAPVPQEASERASHLLMLGSLAFARRDLVQARRDFEQALEAAREAPEPPRTTVLILNDIAEVDLAEGKLEAAAARLAEAIETIGPAPEEMFADEFLALARERRASVLVRLGRLPEAVTVMTELHQGRDDSTEVGVDVAACHFALGDHAQAGTVARQLIPRLVANQSPRRVDAEAIAAAAELRAGDPEQAISRLDVPALLAEDSGGPAAAVLAGALEAAHRDPIRASQLRTAVTSPSPDEATCMTLFLDAVRDGA
jgi:tetratricopeptide (TPR) repeat protein